MCNAGAAAGGAAEAFNIYGQEQLAKAQFSHQTKIARRNQQFNARTAERNLTELRQGQSQEDIAVADALNRLQRGARLGEGEARVQAAASGAAGGSVQESINNFLRSEQESANNLLRNQEFRDDQFDAQARGIRSNQEIQNLNSLPAPVYLPSFLTYALQIGTTAGKEGNS